MTFKETDFVGLFRSLKHFSYTEEDPELFRNIVKLLLNLYEQVPIYPGIADMSLNSAVHNSNYEKLAVGDLVSIKNGNKHITGKITGKAGKKFTLTDVTISECASNLEVEIDGEARTMDFDILKKTWPTLVFDEK